MAILPGKYRIKNAMAWTTFDEATDCTHIIHGWQQTNQPNQHWLVQTAQARDLFTMKNLASGLYASVDGVCNGSQLHGSKDKYSWSLDQDTDGSVFITVPRTNHVADLDNGNPANGTIIHLWEKSGARQQRWYFERI